MSKDIKNQLNFEIPPEEIEQAIFSVFLNQIGELAKEKKIQPKTIISYSWDNPHGYQFYTLDEFKKNTSPALIPAEKAIILTNIEDETDSSYKVYIKMNNKIEEREIKIEDRGSIPLGTGELTAHVGEDVYKLIKKVAEVKDEDLPYNRRITLFREMLYQANVQAEIDCYDATTVGPYVDKFKDYPGRVILAATPLLKLKCDKERLSNGTYPHWVAKEFSLILERLKYEQNSNWFVPVIFSQEGDQQPFPKELKESPKYQEYKDQPLKFTQDNHYKEFLKILTRIFDETSVLENIKKRIECLNKEKYPSLFTPMGLLALREKLLSPEQIIKLGNTKLKILLNNIGAGAMLLKLITAEQAKELDESTLQALLIDECGIAAMLLKIKEKNGKKLSVSELRVLTNNLRRSEKISLFGAAIGIVGHSLSSEEKLQQIFSKAPIEKFKNHFFDALIDLIGESARKNETSPHIIIRSSINDNERIKSFSERLNKVNIKVTIINNDDEIEAKPLTEETKHAPTVILAATPSLQKELKEVDFITKLLSEKYSDSCFIPVIFAQDHDKAPFPDILKEANITEVLKYLDDNNDEIFFNILRRIYKHHCDRVSRDIENSILWMKNFHSLSSSSSHRNSTSGIPSKFGFYSLRQFLTADGIQALRKGFTPEFADKLGIASLELMLSERGLSALLLGLMTVEQVISVGARTRELFLSDEGMTAMLLGKINIEKMQKLNICPYMLKLLLTNNGFRLLMSGSITPEQAAKFTPGNLELLLTNNGLAALSTRLITPEQVVKFGYHRLKLLLTDNGLAALSEGRITADRALELSFIQLESLLADKRKTALAKQSSPLSPPKLSTAACTTFGQPHPLSLGPVFPEFITASLKS